MGAGCISGKSGTRIPVVVSGVDHGRRRMLRQFSTFGQDCSLREQEENVLGGGKCPVSACGNVNTGWFGRRTVKSLLEYERSKRKRGDEATTHTRKSLLSDEKQKGGGGAKMSGKKRGKLKDMIDIRFHIPVFRRRAFNRMKRHVLRRDDKNRKRKDGKSRRSPYAVIIPNSLVDKNYFVVGLMENPKIRAAYKNRIVRISCYDINQEKYAHGLTDGESVTLRDKSFRVSTISFPNVYPEKKKKKKKKKKKENSGKGKSFWELTKSLGNSLRSSLSSNDSGRSSTSTSSSVDAGNSAREAFERREKDMLQDKLQYLFEKMSDEQYRYGKKRKKRKSEFNNNYDDDAYDFLPLQKHVQTEVMTGNRYSHRKFLVILDNLNTVQQIRYLCFVLKEHRDQYKKYPNYPNVKFVVVINDLELLKAMPFGIKDIQHFFFNEFDTRELNEAFLQETMPSNHLWRLHQKAQEETDVKKVAEIKVLLATVEKAVSSVCMFTQAIDENIRFFMMFLENALFDDSERKWNRKPKVRSENIKAIVEYLNNLVLEEYAKNLGYFTSGMVLFEIPSYLVEIASIEWPEENEEVTKFIEVVPTVVRNVKEKEFHDDEDTDFFDMTIYRFVLKNEKLKDREDHGVKISLVGISGKHEQDSFSRVLDQHSLKRSIRQNHKKRFFKGVVESFVTGSHVLNFIERERGVKVELKFKYSIQGKGVKKYEEVKLETFLLRQLEKEVVEIHPTKYFKYFQRPINLNSSIPGKKLNVPRLDYAAKSTVKLLNRIQRIICRTWLKKTPFTMDGLKKEDSVVLESFRAILNKIVVTNPSITFYRNNGYRFVEMSYAEGSEESGRLFSCRKGTWRLIGLQLDNIEIELCYRSSRINLNRVKLAVCECQDLNHVKGKEETPGDMIATMVVKRLD